MITVMIFLVDKTESFCPTCDIGEASVEEELRSKARPKSNVWVVKVLYICFFFFFLFLYYVFVVSHLKIYKENFQSYHGWLE